MSSRANTPQNPSQRVALALQNVNKPVPCEKCGGIFFAELQCQIFTGGNYGMRPVSQTPQKLYMCVCGEVIIPANIKQGVQPGSERDLFIKSVQAAVEYRSRHTLDNVAKGVASVSELEVLRNRIAVLEEQLANGGDPDAEDFSSAEEQLGEPEGTNDVPAEVETVLEANPDAQVTVPVSTAPVRTGRPNNTAGEEIKHVEPDPRRPQTGKGGARARLRRQGA